MAAPEQAGPGPTAGTTAAEGPLPPPDDVEPPVSAGTSCGWDVATVDRPTTPTTWEASEEGTAGCWEAKRATRPSASRVATSGTSKACSIWAEVPVAGMSSPSGEVAPGCRPVDVSHDRVAAMVSGVGPKVDSELATGQIVVVLG